MRTSREPSARTDGGVIQSSTIDSDKIRRGVVALAELTQFKKPKRMSHAHAYNVRDCIAQGFAQTEQRHVLMDYERGTQLKARMLTRLEAWKRNHILRGSGFAWALCSK